MEHSTMNRKQAYSRRVIREALVELMKTTPFSKITVTAICLKADVNRTTFYANYVDLYDLLHSILLDLHEKLEQVLRRYDRTDGRSYYALLLQAIKDNADACYVGIHLPKEEFRELGIDFDYTQMMENRKWRDLHGNSFTENLILDYVLAGTRSTLYKWIESDMEIPIPVMAEHLHYINGQLLRLQPKDVSRLP